MIVNRPCFDTGFCKLKKLSCNILPLTPKNGIAVDDLVLTNIARHAGGWPQLGKGISINNETLTIHWFKGSKTGPWTQWTRKGRSMDGEVNEADVWCHGFTLTNTNKLPSKIKDHIENYAEF